MILTRAPLRIPVGGGGTDFPSYYLKHGGYILGFAIDKYVHVALNETIDSKVRLKYSKNEVVDTADQLENRIAAEALKFYGIENGIEIVTFSDVPEGSGLGSSSAFCVALVAALRQFTKRDLDKEILFNEAYQIERVLAAQPGGMQDQWFAAYGGVHCFELGSNDEHVKSRSIDLQEFIERLRLIYAGGGRTDLGIAERQNEKTASLDQGMIRNLDNVKRIGFLIEDSIRKGNYDKVGRIFHHHWLNKKNRDSSITNSDINRLYELARYQGVSGGKLLGLGGGGYLLLYTNNGWKHPDEIEFSIDYEGAKVVYQT